MNRGAFLDAHDCSDTRPLSGAVLEGIAATYGTPVFVLNLDRVRANLKAVGTDVSPARLLFSLKTNYLRPVLEVVRECGAGVDVVSGYELRAALAAGFTGSEIVFNGPSKTREELAAAIEAGVFVNVDLESEIEILERLAKEQGREIHVGLRVYPPQDVYAPNDVDRSRTVPSKFGWPIAGGDAGRVARLIAQTKGLRLAGIHCHLGSQITSEGALLRALTSVLDWLAALDEADSVDVLNLGGGFGVRGIQRHHGATAALSQVESLDFQGATRAKALNVRVVAASVQQLLAERRLSRLCIHWEPGRAIVSDAVTLLTSVRGIKATSGGRWAILDGGLNLMPTAGIAERHQIRALTPGARTISYMVGGPLCYEGDVFSLDTQLPDDLAPGDLVAIEDAGAYSITRATSFNQPRAAVVALQDDRHWLCWRAEQDDDIFRFAVPTAVVG